jgi:hypothetical protein
MATAVAIRAAYDTGKPRVIGPREQDIFLRTNREFGQYQLWRNVHAGQWQETAQLIDPDSANTFFYQNFNFPGQKKNLQQIDASGMLAVQKAIAIYNSLVTPRVIQWHGMEASDPNVRKRREVVKYFEERTRIQFEHRYAATANFFSQNMANWSSLACYGNGTMFIDRFDGRMHRGVRGLRYRGVPLGETYFGQNHQGQVDRIIRWFRMPAYAAVQKWGREWLPAELAAPLEQDSQFPYSFLHCVRPRDEDYDPDAYDERQFPFESYYLSLEGKCLMAPPSGYPVFPYAVARHMVKPGEVYARGPGQTFLPTLKTLNAQKTVHLKVGHQEADPTLYTADDGLIGSDRRPGAINKGAVSADGKLLVQRLPAGDVRITEKMMGEERSIIEEGFLVSIFKTLIENPNMKATQVIAIMNERGMLVAPTLGGLFDYVNQLAEREGDILDTLTDERGRPIMPPMPPALREAGRAYRITDTSPLSQLAKMGGAAGFNMWVENLRQLAADTQDPSWLDIVSRDRSARGLAETYSVPIDYTATEDELAQKAKSRANAQQQQARVEALPAEAAMISAQAKAASKGPQQVPQPGAPV